MIRLKAKRPQFYKLYSWVAERYGMASSKAAVVTIVLSYHEAGRNCFLSLQALADLAGCSKRKVQNDLTELIREGVIRKNPSNVALTNEYTVVLPNETKKEEEPKNEPQPEEPQRKESQENSQPENNDSFYDELLNESDMQWI